MENIVVFFLNFGQYCKDAAGTLGYCILVPLATLAAIWLLTFIGLKVVVKKGKLKSVYLIHKAIIVSSLIVAAVLVAIICYCWTKNVFAYTHAELAFIISLIFAFVVPIVSLFVLRGYYEKSRMNEITGQSISAKQASDNISVIRKAFNKNKIYYLLPLIGFLFLLFSLNAGKNLISIVFDNSGTMEGTDSYIALNQTFEKLSDNNEILITTLNGLPTDWQQGQSGTMQSVMTIKSSSKIKAGKNYSFNTPLEAQNGLNTILNTGEAVYGSPICEATWKMWLFTKETKSNVTYKNKLLILITDGEENLVKDLNKFFYDDTEFAEYYTPENTHVIDYSQTGNGILIKKFEDSGANIYPAVTSVDDYLNALDEALASFQNNFYLIVWIIVIYVIFSIIGLCITPKNISL
jgi:hypothetical protein